MRYDRVPVGSDLYARVYSDTRSTTGTWYLYRVRDTRCKSTHIFGVYRYKARNLYPDRERTVFMLKPCALRMYPLRYQVPGTDTRHNTCTQYHKTKLTTGILLYTVFILCTVILFDYRYIPYPYASSDKYSQYSDFPGTPGTLFDRILCMC